MATHHDGRAVSGYQDRKLLPKWRRASKRKETGVKLHNHWKSEPHFHAIEIEKEANRKSLISLYHRQPTSLDRL